MTESDMAVEGVVVTLLTPLDEEERVDEPALRALIRNCLDGGGDALFVGGDVRLAEVTERSGT